MGCSSVCSIKACRTGADRGFGGMSRLRFPSQMPAISLSGPRFLSVLTSMLDGSVKMSPGLRIVHFLSTEHFVSSKLVSWSHVCKGWDAKRLPAASADSRRLVDSAVISKSSERLQSGDVRLRRPAAIRIRPDDADANSPGHDVLLNM